MSELTWVVEKSPYDEDNEATRLAEEVKSQGHKVIVIPYKPFNDFYDIALEVLDKRSIFHGSIESAIRYGKLATAPGPYYDPSAFYCSKYSPFLGCEYVNWRARYYPSGLLKHMENNLYGSFVRPDSSRKFFKPQFVHPDNVHLVLAEIEHYCTPSQMIMVCPGVQILHEYRVWVIDGKAVTASRYHSDGVLDIFPNAPSEVLEYAERIFGILNKAAPYITPDNVCCVDVAEVIDNDDKRSIKVMEISAFGCAGLYACDLKKVVESVSRNALSLSLPEIL